MKILLLTLGLALVCGLQADNVDENLSILTGEWHTVALASSVKSKIEEGGKLRMYVKKITEENGGLKGTFLKRENDTCTDFSVQTYKGENGENLVEYDGLNEFTLQDLGPNYAILTLVNKKDGDVTIWAELFGRTSNLPSEVKRKFRKICKEHGINKRNIIDLYKDDRCSKLRDS